MDWFTKSWRTKKKTRKEFSVNAQEKQRLGLIGIVRTKLDKAEH